jgi:hypothetical protein
MVRPTCSVRHSMEVWRELERQAGPRVNARESDPGWGSEALDGVRHDLAVLHVNDAEGMAGLPAAFGRRARVEQALTVHALLVAGDVTMPEDDQRGIGEEAMHPRGAPCGRTGVVHHCDPNSLVLEHELVGKHADQFAHVVVPEHSPDRGKAREVL